MSNSNNIINSMTGAFVAEILTLPICTIKTQFQNTDNKTIRRTISNIYSTGGVRAFYRASIPAISSQVFSSASKYAIYSYLEDKKYKYTNRLTNGIISGILTSIITHPIDFFKVHLQMNTPIIPEFKKYGIGVMYRGYSKSFLKVCVGSSLFFPLHFTIKESVEKQNIKYSAFISSSITAIISTIIMHPFDYLKTRHIYNVSLYSSYNPLKYYRGLTLNLLRIVPHYVIMMSTIDFIEKKFKK